MSFTWIYVWVALIFIAAFARLFIAVATSTPKKKDGRGETSKPKTERRTGAKRSTGTSTAQDADAFGLALSHDRSASGLPKWQRYYGNATDWE
jgi:hypothetical protein